MGKTYGQAKLTKDGVKHPHAHGEDRERFAVTSAISETPPRAWGRPPQANLAAIGTGNTPTRMGKTTYTTYSLTVKRKHPHAHGEDPMIKRKFQLLF